MSGAPKVHEAHHDVAAGVKRPRHGPGGRLRDEFGSVSCRELEVAFMRGKRRMTVAAASSAVGSVVWVSHGTQSASSASHPTPRASAARRGLPSCAAHLQRIVAQRRARGAGQRRLPADGRRVVRVPARALGPRRRHAGAGRGSDGLAGALAHRDAGAPRRLHQGAAGLSARPGGPALGVAGHVPRGWRPELGVGRKLAPQAPFFERKTLTRRLMSPRCRLNSPLV